MGFVRREPGAGVHAVIRRRGWGGNKGGINPPSLLPRARPSLALALEHSRFAVRSLVDRWWMVGCGVSVGGGRWLVVVG